MRRSHGIHQRATTRRTRPRLTVLGLEDRTVPVADVGDTLAKALNTHLGSSPGTYTMLSQHIGDGSFGAADVDMFQFQANAGEVLKANTSAAVGGAPVDTYLRLFDANGNELAANDDYTNAGLYSQIADYVFGTSGTYYIGVSGSPNRYYNPAVGGSGTGSYTTGDYRLDLNLYIPTADAAGDTLATAQATGVGPAGTFAVDAHIGDGLYVSKDVDLYRLDNVAAGQFLTAQTSLPVGGTQMYTILRVFDSTGHEVASDWTSNYPYSRVRYQFATAGTYYVGVSGQYNWNYDPNVGGSGYEWSLGDYHLDLTLVTPTADAAGDDLAHAQATGLTNTTPFSATAKLGDGLFPLKDVDLYRVDVSAGQVLSAVTSLPTGGTPINPITLRVFDSAGTQQTISYYGYGSSNRIDWQFATAGAYYVGVSGYPNYNYNPNVGGSGAPYYTPATGDYKLDLTLVTPTADLEGDTTATALAATLTSGSYSHTAKIGDGLNPLQDVDLYRLDNVQPGQVLTASTALPAGGNYMYTLLRVFDASGNQVGYSIYGYGWKFEYQFAAGGTYYVGISGNPNYNYNPVTGANGYPGSRGDYQLNLTLATPTADTAPDSIGAITAANLGPANGTFATDGHIGDGLYPLRDVDLYRIDVSAAGQGLTAVTSPPTGGTSMYTTLRLFDSAGNQLAVNTFGNGNYSRLSYLFASPGTYYIGVSGYGNSSYNPTSPVTGGAPLGNRGDYHLDLALVTPTLDSVGDSMAAALDTGLTTGVPYSANAHIGDGFWGNLDVDMYKFSGTAGQRLTVSTTRAAPFYYDVVRVFDSTGHQITWNYGFLTTRINNLTLPATGTYYIGVSGYSNFNYDPAVGGSGYPAYYTGDYRIDMSLVTPTADAEPDSIAGVTAAVLGPTAGTYAHDAKIGDGLYANKDVDLYRVDVTAGQLLRIATSQPAGGQFMVPIIRLFNAAGTQLAWNYNYYSANTSLEYQIPAGAGGTYYVGVSGYYNPYYNPNVAGSGYDAYLTGDYHLDLTLITPTPDAEGDTIGTAVVTGVTEATPYSHTAKLGDGAYFAKDVDLYAVTLAAGQVLTATAITPPGGTPVSALLRIFDATGAQVDGITNALEFTASTAGTYYVGVSSYPNYNYDPNVGGSGTPYYTPSAGDYQLNLSVTTPTPDAVGDTIATALDTQLGPNAGTYSMPGTRIGDGLYVSRDQDVYQFRVQAGQVFTAISSLPAGGTPVGIVLTLFDANGNYITSTGGSGNSDAQLQLKLDTHGTYYLVVTGEPNWWVDPNNPGTGSIGGHGDYRLDLTLDKQRAPVGGGGPAVQSIRGHAVWNHTVGLPRGGQSIDQVSINSWLDAAGVAHGNMEWTETDHRLPGGGGRTFSGYPWHIRVDTLVIAGNTAHIEGVVISSGQAPENVGIRVAFDVVDNGSGTDLLNGQPLDGGNFTISGSQALHAAAVATHPVAASALPEASLDRLFREALRRWRLAGADVTGLRNVQLRVADLGGTTLGIADGNTIWIDDNADGWGWFIDRTPRSDREFIRPGNQGEQNHIDLLTVMMHEVGHLLGHEHVEGGVMTDTLAAGTRVTPTGAVLGGLLSAPIGNTDHWGSW